MKLWELGAFGNPGEPEKCIDNRNKRGRPYLFSFAWSSLNIGHDNRWLVTLNQRYDWPT